jgi:hypothetical protein
VRKILKIFVFLYDLIVSILTSLNLNKMNMNKLYSVLFFSTLFCFSIVSKIQAQTQLTVTILNQTPVCNMDASVTLGITGGVGPYTSHWLRYGLNQQQDTVLTSTINPVT